MTDILIRSAPFPWSLRDYHGKRRSLHPRIRISVRLQQWCCTRYRASAWAGRKAAMLEQEMDDKHEQLEDERLRERKAAFRRHAAAQALAPYTPMEDRSPDENHDHSYSYCPVRWRTNTSLQTFSPVGTKTKKRRPFLQIIGRDMGATKFEASNAGPIIWRERLQEVS